MKQARQLTRKVAGMARGKKTAVKADLDDVKVDTEAAEGEETTAGGTPAAAEPESTTAAVLYSAPVEMTEAEKLKAMPDVTA